MLKRREVCAWLMLVSLVCGCTDPKVNEMAKPSPKAVTWPELAALRDPQVAMGIFVNAQRGDMAGLKKAAADPKLEELVNALDGSKIPAEFASPSRDKAKAKVVTGYKSLIGFAKGVGTPKQMKEAAMAIQEDLNELTKN